MHRSLFEINSEAVRNLLFESFHVYGASKFKSWLVMEQNENWRRNCYRARNPLNVSQHENASFDTFTLLKRFEVSR